ncbi:reverse transcriptase domain-containing protein [Streptomyces milbemycinicus]|uniref:Reverse transcriptase domain-containing protein n=1 Tax=Streptomyces milbemycinicus TaxID=476552 RepID=A0ABW8M517_9ACTN
MGTIRGRPRGAPARTPKGRSVVDRWPRGGILSPLLANIALSALDQHLTRPREPGGDMATSHLRRRSCAAGRANWRIIRYADDLVVLVDGERDDVEALREDISDVLRPLAVFVSPRRRRRWCTCRRGSASWGSASSGTASEEGTSGTSTPSSLTGPSGS